MVFPPGADTPILSNFLPLHHLVMVRADTILPFLDDYAAATAGQRPPRNVNIVTGPSGTTDIEGSLVLGAHGRFLHVVIVGEVEPAAGAALEPGLILPAPPRADHHDLPENTPSCPWPPANTRSSFQAAHRIMEADGLLVASGAGMGVDSGLPDFRGREGFWRAYPLGAPGCHSNRSPTPAAFA